MEELDQNWHALEASKALKILESTENGLSEEEAQKRASKFGMNKIEKKEKTPAYLIFAYQFKSPLIYILFIAGLISLFLRHFVDASVIFGAVAINALIGFIQEYKANNTLAKLRTFFVPTTIVMREGSKKEIQAEELVPGDIIELKNGDLVPADARIIKADNLEINESVLTGEAKPVDKTPDPAILGSALGDRFSMAYSGTSVVKGTGLAVITATGMQTEIGKIAASVSETREESTPLQIKLSRFGNYLGIAISILCIIIVIAGVFLSRLDFFDLFITGVAIAVSAIPEGLPVAVSVILITGMQHILKRKALVRKLIATEALGSITAICTDKTGTLTEGKMQITDIIFPDQKINVAVEKFREENPDFIIHTLKIGMLCNDAIVEGAEELEKLKIIGSPTEKALMQTAIQSGLNPNVLARDYPRLSELPFDSSLKYMLTLHEVKTKDKIFKGPFLLLYKGAPEIVLGNTEFYYKDGEKKQITEAVARNIKNEISALTEKGYRLIALAFKNMDGAPPEDPHWEDLAKGSVFVGLMVIRDPLRAEVKSTIKLCRTAGIKPIIITGDHPKTAMAIAEEAGIPLSQAKPVTGEALDKTDDNELKRVVRKTSVFARISPHHKLRIVRALRIRGEVVAMAGDGVNDAPAIKAADIGISVGSGSDVTKETADIILLDNNFSTIVAAVEQGRVIFSNIRKVVTFLLSDSFSEIILICGALLTGLPLPLIPAQILWINIVNDGFPNFALAFEEGEEGIMHRPPVSKSDPIINRDMRNIIFFIGIGRDILIFAFFYYILSQSMDITYVRTVIFAVLGVKSLMSIFSLRNLNKMLYQHNPFRNSYLNVSVILSFALILLVIYWPPMQKLISTKPLDIYSWVTIFLIGIFNLIILELYKLNFIIPKLEKK